MAKKKPSNKFENISTDELENEIEDRKRKEKLKEHVWKIKKIENIPDHKKIAVFDKLYASVESYVDQYIEAQVLIESTPQYIYEEVLSALFGESVWEDCINKIEEQKKVRKIKV